MKVSSLFVAAALLSMQDDSKNSLAPGAGPPAITQESRTMQPGQPEPPPTVVGLNDVAPDFSYQTADGRWRHLHEMVRTGPVLLVFGATDLVLRSLEHEREPLMDLGVIPVVVLEGRSGPARSTVERLGLRYTVIADSRSVIAEQFNAVNPTTGRQLASLFVIDRGCRVRALERVSLPVRGYVSLAANALGIAQRDVPLPASR